VERRGPDTFVWPGRSAVGLLGAARRTARAALHPGARRNAADNAGTTGGTAPATRERNAPDKSDTRPPPRTNARGTLSPTYPTASRRDSGNAMRQANPTRRTALAPEARGAMRPTNPTLPTPVRRKRAASRHPPAHAVRGGKVSSCSRRFVSLFLVSFCFVCRRPPARHAVPPPPARFPAAREPPCTPIPRLPTAATSCT
jgi:hypothetical protein